MGAKTNPPIWPGVQTDSEGNSFLPISYTMAYTGTQLDSITCLATNGKSYKMTLTYVASNLTAASGWVLQ